MQAIVTPEFLSLIPAVIRQRLHLKAGTLLDFDEQAPFLKAIPLNQPPDVDLDDMMACIGAGKGGYLGLSSAEWLTETRGPVELPPPSLQRQWTAPSSSRSSSPPVNSQRWICKSCQMLRRSTSDMPRFLRVAFWKMPM